MTKKNNEALEKTKQDLKQLEESIIFSASISAGLALLFRRPAFLGSLYTASLIGDYRSTRRTYQQQLDGQKDDYKSLFEQIEPVKQAYNLGCGLFSIAHKISETSGVADKTTELKKEIMEIIRKK